MKKAALLALFLSLPAFASFKDVKSVLCNGAIVENASINRVFIDLDRSILGFAQVEVNGEQKCNVADFTSVVITSHSSINGRVSATVQTAFEIGRKSTCAEDILEYKGPAFQVAKLSGESLILLGTQDCETLEFKLK